MTGVIADRKTIDGTVTDQCLLHDRGALKLEPFNSLLANASVQMPHLTEEVSIL